MRFLTAAEAREWWGRLQARVDERGAPALPSAERHFHAAGIPKDLARLTWFCRHLEQALQPRDACLLWVTQWGIWGSSENLHLYYKLRQSYGDVRLLNEAPGHVFLRHESADLVSFLEVGILCGWDIHLLPVAGYARAFVSHDEQVEYAADDSNPDLVKQFASGLADGSKEPEALNPHGKNASGRPGLDLLR